MLRKRILSQKRPAAGGEARLRAFFIVQVKIPAFCFPLYREQGLSVKKFPVDVQDIKLSKVNSIVRMPYPEVSFPCHKLRYFMRSQLNYTSYLKILLIIIQ